MDFFVIVYNITSSESFDNIKVYLKEIKNYSYI